MRKYTVPLSSKEEKYEFASYDEIIAQKSIKCKKKNPQKIEKLLIIHIRTTKPLSNTSCNHHHFLLC
jgi:hypothetical protein